MGMDYAGKPVSVGALKGAPSEDASFRERLGFCVELLLKGMDKRALVKACDIAPENLDAAIKDCTEGYKVTITIPKAMASMANDFAVSRKATLEEYIETIFLKEFYNDESKQGGPDIMDKLQMTIVNHIAKLGDHKKAS